jgi:hypothetical protein
MRMLNRTNPKRADMPVVGYVDRRTGQIVCTRHGVRDIESRHSPWAAIHVIDPHKAGYVSTTTVICHQCGVWLNGESTGYAIVSPQDDYGPPSLWPRPCKRPSVG